MRLPARDGYATLVGAAIGATVSSESKVKGVWYAVPACTDADHAEPLMIWNPSIETMPRVELAALQLSRLQAVLARVYDRVPFYRRAFHRAGVAPEQVRTLSDLRCFPWTRKSDLRDQYPFGLFAVPQDQVVRLHASSGTTGVVPHSAGHLRFPGPRGPAPDSWTFAVCHRRRPCESGDNDHAQPPVMPSLVAMTPTVIRARRSVRREIRATCAWQSIHEAGMGRPSRSIVRSHAVARSCLGEGRLDGMGTMEGVGGWRAGTGVRIGEPGDLTEGMNRSASCPPRMASAVPSRNSTTSTSSPAWTPRQVIHGDVCGRFQRGIAHLPGLSARRIRRPRRGCDR